MIIERTLQNAIRNYIGKYPILAVTGPRQSGKTTMLRHLFEDYRYVSLENPDNRDFALNDPNGFFKQYDSRVIIDEVQQAPDLFSYMQTIVDEKKQMGQFIISGSQNFLLMERITQSLAGRIALFKLFPFDNDELSKSGLLSEDYYENMIKGFYPAIYDRKIPSGTFYDNYMQTYVQRDVSSLLSVKDLRQFRNFIGLCAARVGQLLNLNGLARECGISQPTAKAWLSTLESSYIVFLLHPYFENFNKRIMKSPKLYFYDTGLLAFLLKFIQPKQLITHPVKGSLFENMVIADVVKKISHAYSLTETWFWRDASGNEVDLLLIDDQGIRVCEIKTTQTILSKMFKGLDYFQTLSGNTIMSKTVIYGGDEDQERSNGAVVSWKNFRI